MVNVPTPSAVAELQRLEDVLLLMLHQAENAEKAAPANSAEASYHRGHASACASIRALIGLHRRQISGQVLDA